MNLPILMYHIIRPEPIANSDLAVPTAHFQEQVAWLQGAGYQSITLEVLAESLLAGKPLPRRPVVFTFDDALETVFTNAFPILRESGFAAAVFAVSQAVGRHNLWDDGKNLPKMACLTAEQLKILRDAGWEIGSHGATHANLKGLAPAALAREIAGSKKELEKIMAGPVVSFCYPFGSLDSAAQAAVREAGYKAACAISPGTKSVTANRYALRRIYVKPKDTLADFRRKISGWYLTYRAWRKR